MRVKIHIFEEYSKLYERKVVNHEKNVQKYICTYLPLNVILWGKSCKIMKVDVDLCFTW